MSEDSDQEKTEDPTPHRLSEARRKGDIPRSRELTSLMMLACGWGVLWLGGAHIVDTLAHTLQEGLMFRHDLINDEKQEWIRVGHLVLFSLSALLPLFLGMFLVALTSSTLIGGFSFNFESISLSFTKLNPISGIKRLFSLRVVFELLKSLLKVSLVGFTVFIYIRGNWDAVLRLLYEHSFTAMGNALSFIAHCILLVILSLIPMLGYDIFYQKFSYIKKLRMTRQEIRDEFKQQEGDPKIKGRIRQQQRTLARQRMMANVPNADVIVNNPTHYSVALQYQEGIMSAPKVIAKGAGELALKIREIASENRIPMLEAPPLARALYRHTDIDQQIPAALYSAVAEVLAWIYGLRRWQKVGGVQPKRPHNISVPASLDFGKEESNH